MSMKIVALKPITQDGRVYQRGESLTVSDDASGRDLIAKGYAVLPAIYEKTAEAEEKDRKKAERAAEIEASCRQAGAAATEEYVRRALAGEKVKIEIVTVKDGGRATQPEGSSGASAATS